MDINTTYPDDNYTIHVGHNILRHYISEYADDYDSVFYVIDENVYDTHQNRLDFVRSPVLLKSGEEAKTGDHYLSLVERLLSEGVKRNSLIFVIGGGAAGDVGGFAAATAVRGVDYIQVPTTLLSHDSAIGGKTAINSAHGKNLIGAFYRPEAVIYDLEFLYTLPHSELLSGFGEVFKHSLLKGEPETRTLMDITEDGIKISTLEDSIINGIYTKMDIVVKDEHETGARKFLNLGHTLGHAIEYRFKIPHGQAVTLGLYAMMFISNKYCGHEIFELSRFSSYFSSLGYPMHYLKEMDTTEMITLMTKDKKNLQNDSIGYVIMSRECSPQFIELPTKILQNHLHDLKESL